MKMICRWAVLVSAFLPFSAAQTTLSPATLQFSAHYIDSPAGQTSLIVADRAGNLFVVSNVCAVSACPASQPSTIQVTRTDLSGNVLGVFSFGGSGWSVANAAVIDNSGNLVIGGSSTSPDFPLVSPLQTTGGAFLTKIDPMLQGIVYSTKVGSTNPNFASTVNAMAIDGAGNTYITGTTGAGLPVTPGAFQTQGSVAIDASSAYVAELNASGSALVFATYYSGTLGTALVGTGLGGLVPLYPPITSPIGITVDGAGEIIVTGGTSDNLPVTPGAYSTVAPTGPLDGVGFAAKFSAGGTGLVWGTYLPGVSIYCTALDGAGNLVLSGLTGTGLATTANAIQPSFPPAPSPLSAGAVIDQSAGFLLKLASTGDKLIDATYFGGNTVTGFQALNPTGVNGLAIDESGNIWITGGSAPVALPSNSGPALGQNYIAELSPDLETLLALNSVPDGSAGVAIASAPGGTLATIGTGNLLLLANSGAGPSFLGLASSPGFRTSPAIAPAELVTLYGIGIGPAAGQTAQIGSDGVIGTVLGGVQVLFNGVPAALLYAGPNQINAIVPEAVRGLGQTSVQIVAPAATIDVAGLMVQDYAPTMFGTIGEVAAPALNADGTINGPSNPAPLGSIVAVWLTGAGSAGGTDNQINIPAPRSSPASISVLAYPPSGIPLPLNVLYAGDAPDQPNGVSQINFQLPATGTNSVILPGTQSFNVQVGSVTSLPFLIYVQ